MERPQKESSRAKAACEAYLALGPGRSLEKLHQTSKGLASLRWLAEWSRTFEWQERAAAYDAAQLAKQRGEREHREAEERERRHKQRLADLDALRPIADEARDLMKAMELLKDPKDILKFYEFIHRGERLELGEATSRTELSVHELSDEQLAAEAATRGIRILRRVG